MADATRIALDRNCDISKAESLHGKLEAMLDGSIPIEIDASAVERIDTSHLQLLSSFIKTLNQHHVEVHLIKPSECFVDAARLLGLAPQLGLKV